MLGIHVSEEVPESGEGLFFGVSVGESQDFRTAVAVDAPRHLLRAARKY